MNDSKVAEYGNRVLASGRRCPALAKITDNKSRKHPPANKEQQQHFEKRPMRDRGGDELPAFQLHLDEARPRGSERDQQVTAVVRVFEIDATEGKGTVAKTDLDRQVALVMLREESLFGGFVFAFHRQHQERQERGNDGDDSQAGQRPFRRKPNPMRTTLPPALVVLVVGCDAFCHSPPPVQAPQEVDE